LDLDRALHRVAVEAELFGDRADGPVFGVEEAPDVGVLLAGDHRRSSSSRARSASSMRSCFRSWKWPMPRRRSRTRGALAPSTTSSEYSGPPKSGNQSALRLAAYVRRGPPAHSTARTGAPSHKATASISHCSARGCAGGHESLAFNRTSSRSVTTTRVAVGSGLTTMNNFIVVLRCRGAGLRRDVGRVRGNEHAAR